MVPLVCQTRSTEYRFIQYARHAYACVDLHSYVVNRLLNDVSIIQYEYKGGGVISNDINEYINILSIILSY